MVNEIKVEELSKLETIVIYAGGVGLAINRQASPAFKKADWIETLTCDCKEGVGVEVALDLNIVKKILSSPGPYNRQYDVSIPKLGEEEIDKFEEGLMLNPSIGFILSFASEQRILSKMLSKVKLAAEGADIAREQNLTVLKNFQFICNTSPAGGTGASIVLPHCSAIKRHYPGSRVCLLSCFDYICEAVPTIEAAETILRNIKGFLGNLVELEENAASNRFKFLDFREAIPKSLPDHVFWIIGVEHLDEYVKDAAQLNEDISYGIPFRLPDFENAMMRKVKQRGIITAMQIYEFPKEKTKNFIAMSSLREQLIKIIKSGKSETLIGRDSLEKAIDASIQGISEEINKRRTEIKEEKANLEEIFSKIDKEIKVRSSELQGEFKSYYSQLTNEIESIWRDGRLDEISHRINRTIAWLDTRREKLEKELIEEDDIKKLKDVAKEKYKELTNKKIGFHIFTKIDRLSGEVILHLIEIEEKRRKKTEQSYKLTFLRKIEEDLRNTLKKINSFKSDLEEFYQRKITPPLDMFVQPPKLAGLIDHNYQLPSLDFEEVRREWIEAKEKEIEQKTKESFKVNLLSIRLPNPSEGWFPVSEHTSKPESRIAVIPEFASVEGGEHFDYLIKRGDYWKVVVYHLIANSSMQEFLEAFKRKWWISDEGD